MPTETVVIVEDDENIAELVQVNLVKAGFQPLCVFTGEDAIRTIRSESPDLILLDLMLPGLDGLDVCRLVKADPGTRGIPVIMLTARGEESDIVAGLELGADDYVTKPFSPRVLVARVRAALRRNRAAGAEDDDTVIRVHDLYIHPGRHEVRVNDMPVELTATEFRLLHRLASRPGWVSTRGQIIEAIHGVGYPVTDRAVDVQIVGLRKKLREAGELVETVRGIGYRMRHDSEG